MAKKKSLKQSEYILNPTIGADIEVFLQDISSKEVVSAEGIIQGSKNEPFQFMDGNPFFATSLDNVMAEFCIPPAQNADEFAGHIQTSMGYISNVIPKNLQIFAYPAVKVNEKYLQTENALLFGCDPDYDAWKFGEMNEKPNATSNLRSCGGHIHVGYDNPNRMLSMDLIRAMDIFIGLPSILQEPDNERKSLYGKAGAFRYKSYGAEYRTVSNYYVTSPELMKWAFNNTMQAVDFVNNKAVISHEEARAIQSAINFNDKQLARTMCDYFSVKLAA